MDLLENFVKDMSRAYRRFQIERLKKNRKNYYGAGRIYAGEPVYVLSARSLAMAVNNPAACSCLTCGNPRRLNGLSIQEKRLFQRLFDTD